MEESDLNLPRKRRRPAKSCEQCRRRKIRCDQNSPCGACIRARAPLLCSYRPEPASPAVPALAPAPAAESMAGVPELSSQAPMDRNPSLVLSPESSTATAVANTTPQRNHPNTGASLVTQQGRTIGDLRHRVQRLEAQLASARTEDREDQLLTPSDTVPQRPRAQNERPSGNSSQSLGSDTCIPVTTPKLRNALDKTKLFGPSHWLHTAEKFQVIGKFDAVEVEPAFTAAQAELTTAVKEARSLRRALLAHSSVQLPSPVLDLVSTLPPKAVCDELVRSYFRTFEVVYRIIHVPTFWKEYNQLWEMPSSTSTPPHFLMKLVLILAIGAAFYPESADTDRVNFINLSQTWIYAAQWWLTGPTEKSTATLDGMQVFCLLILARQVSHKCPGGSTWLSTGSLVAMAQTMGLHRDPKIFPSLTQYQVEMRARLWTTVLELVCKSSLDSALPSNISVDDFDTPMPSNFNDDDLSPDATIERRPREGVTDSSVQILLAKSLPLRIKVAQVLNDFRNEQSYHAALKLGAELRTACRNVAAFFHSSIPQDAQRDSGLCHTDFHRRFLDIYLRKYILLLHRPFMVQAKNDPRFYLARKVCVEAATVIGSYAHNLNHGLGTVPLDDLSILSMVGRGVFKGPLSLDIIVVLASEVITQLEEEGPHHSVADPLDEINKANRAPLIRILEHISDQLLHIIGMGSESLKRYIFVSGYLSYIKAMETGQCAKQIVYEDLIAAVRKCHSLLEAQATRVGAANEATATTTAADPATAPFSSMNMGFIDGDSPWDISYLLDLPFIGDEGQNTWVM